MYFAVIAHAGGPAPKVSDEDRREGLIAYLVVSINEIITSIDHQEYLLRAGIVFDASRSGESLILLLIQAAFSNDVASISTLLAMQFH